MKTPTPEELLQNPSTPSWAAEAIRRALRADPVDAVNTLEVLTKVFAARLETISTRFIK